MNCPFCNFILQKRINDWNTCYRCPIITQFFFKNFKDNNPSQAFFQNNTFNIVIDLLNNYTDVYDRDQKLIMEIPRIIKPSQINKLKLYLTFS